MTLMWIGVTALLLFQKVISREIRRSLGDSEEMYCDEEWYPFGNMCYKLGALRPAGYLTFELADKRCIENGGRLVSIHSQEEQEFLIAFLLFKARSNIWIGLHDMARETKFTWMDGTDLTYTNWEPGEPTGSVGQVYEEDCTVMNFQSRQADRVSGRWNDEQCGQDKQYICKKEKSNLEKPQDPRFCPESEGGGWRHENSCFHLVEDPQRWSDAEEYCINTHKGHLATILNFTTNSYLQYVFKGKLQKAWLGIKINVEVFQQRWISGWFVSYQKWYEKDPIECIALNSGGSWSSVTCSRKLPFICEVSSVSPPVMTPGKGVCPPKPENWRDLGGEKCYFFETSKTLSWNEANFECFRRGGNLASIHSEGENAVLINFVKYPETELHIGLHRSIAKDEKFAWSDGSPMDFENWSIKEPSHLTEQCGEVYSGSLKWNDMPCGSKRGFICATNKIARNETKLQEKTPEEEKCQSSFSLGSIIGAIFCVNLVCILFGVLCHHFHLFERGYDRMKKISGLPMVDKRAKFRSETQVQGNGC